jgi:hypothetical protein
MNLMVVSARLERALTQPPYVCPPLVRANGKRMIDLDWQRGPFHAPDAWRDQLAHHHGNVALPCGHGLLVGDADTYKPGADDAWRALVEDCKLDTDTVRAVSGRGGAHVLYVYPPELHVPSVSLEVRGYPGVEIKAEGGGIVVEPSTHPETGNRYAWEWGGWGPGERLIVTASDELFALLGAAERRPSTQARWRVIDDDALDELEPRNVETARLLRDYFGGHDLVLLSGDTIGIYRPGKDSRSESASITVGYIGPGVGKVWTDSWPPFTQGQVVDPTVLRRIAGIAPKIRVPTIELPSGYRLWKPGDDTRPIPHLAETARYGLVGEYLALLDGETEAGLAAVGAIVLAQLGTLIGRRAVVRIGPYRHHCNLYVVVIGESSIGAKGSADDAGERFTRLVDPDFFVRHAIGGFGSGEALVDAIRDPQDDEDAGSEKRRLINENEFSAVLRVARRESSILSEIIRQGFDYKPIRHRTKSAGSITSTGHHLAVVGSITPIELFACSNELDLENGWLNRFLFVHAEMQAILPFGGEVDDDAVTKIANRARSALAALGDRSVEYAIKASTPTGALWEPWYRKVRTGTGEGRVASLTKRQHVQAARLALIFSVLDQADEIRTEHLQAAIAWTSYSVAGVERYFGHSRGGQLGKLLDAIRDSPDGLSISSQHDVFGRNLKAGQLDKLRAELETAQLIVTITMPSGGRPKDVSFAITPLRANERNEEM